MWWLYIPKTFGMDCGVIEGVPLIYKYCEEGTCQGECGRQKASSHYPICCSVYFKSIPYSSCIFIKPITDCGSYIRAGPSLLTVGLLYWAILALESLPSWLRFPQSCASARSSSSQTLPPCPLSFHRCHIHIVVWRPSLLDPDLFHITLPKVSSE